MIFSKRRSKLIVSKKKVKILESREKIQPKDEDQKPLTSSNPVLELELAEEKLPMTLSRQEVIRRLRERGEPIRLFGETDYDAFQRLRKIEILTPEVNKGLRNDLKAALDKIDQQYLNELVGGQEPGEEDTQNDLKVHEENTTIEELEALGESLGKGDDHKDMDIITKFLKFLLGVWAKELNAREDYVKRSVQGKLNSATQKQTESYLRPLFRKLRKRNLPADIKESITDIIKFMLQREYVKANDAYLQMAIGNAPWPIGVTMVGIHARTGREKIFSKHVAHVLNDETQRKYIQENKKYFKRSELAKKEEEAYFERCGYKIQPKDEDQKPLTSSNPVLELELAEEKLPMTLSRQEVIRRLRERGEPIRLFGETDYDAFQRLRKIEILTPEVNKGLRNDLKAALDKIDQQYLNELVGGQEPGEEDTQNDLKVHEENTTIEELEALGESLGKGDDHKDMDIITKFLKFLLGVWAKELNAREDYVKRSVQGKLNSATQKQTESYLRPLFRKLRKRNLPADIKESITDIIKFMLQREYVKANDAYLQMAIGNAPWPIGVTMVGIHARTGREKIFSKHVAHVLNDETQRKYIQGLKRLMTICQKHFPTDPSKCVEYNAL